MLEAIASFFGYLMSFIFGIVNNYGVAIIIFTVLVKILLLPFTIKQQKSLKQAQEIQPLIQELQKKHGNDQQKFMEEYQKLLKEKKMSTMSSMGCTGCLLNFIQFPIILGLFYMMSNPLTHIMKLDKNVIEQYKQEVNNIRMEQAIATLESASGDYSLEEYEAKVKEASEKEYVDPRYYELDIIKEKNLIDMNFLGIDLCDVGINNKSNLALLIIPILSTIFTYLTVAASSSINKESNEQMKKMQEESEIPMPDMKLMNSVLPLMLGYVAYSVPQGVGLYWATTNFIGVVQLVVMKKFFNEEKKNGVMKKEIEAQVIEIEKEAEAELNEKAESTEITENKTPSQSKKTSTNNNKNKKHKKKK